MGDAARCGVGLEKPLRSLQSAFHIAGGCWLRSALRCCRWLFWSGPKVWKGLLTLVTVTTE